MRRIDNCVRVKRLIDSAIADFSLDLRGISVLTEAASGPFVVTPLIAALAGAKQTIAVTKDSAYGTATDIGEYTKQWARKLGVAERIEVTAKPAYMYANSVDLVTNLGFVRPIDKKFVKLLSAKAVISLMWESWEFRDEDIDLAACWKKGIPVLGTCETHPRLQTYRYVGLVALKLLLEANIEVFKSNILLVGSGHFAEETKAVLHLNGCHLMHVEPDNNWDNNDQNVARFIKAADAIVLVEHKARFCLLGGETGLPLDWFDNCGAVIIHLCGNIDEAGLLKHGLSKLPARKVAPGFMTLTTDYVGPRPVIDLHTAGLKVGEVMARAKRENLSLARIEERALMESPAQGFSEQQKKRYGWYNNACVRVK